jgi:hypothetical protein
VLFTNARLSASGSFLLLNLGDTILPQKGTLHKSIAYHPIKRGAQLQDLTLHFSRLDGTLGRDTTIHFAVNVTRGLTKLSSSLASADFGSVYACQLRDTVLWLKNTGCDTLTVDSGAFSDRSYRSDRTYPLILPPDSSAPVHVFVSPDTTGHPLTISGSYSYFSNADSGKSGSVPFQVTMIYPVKLRLALLKSDSAGAGKIVTFAVVLQGAAGGALHAVTGVSFELTHNDDLLSYLGASTIFIHSRVTGGDARATRDSFAISGLSASDTIGTLTFQVFLTDARSTSLQLSNVTLNNSAGVPNECIASIDDSGAAFSYIYSCSDGLIQEFMQSGGFQIDGIAPNPSTGMIAISYRLAGGEAANATVFFEDVLGKTLLTDRLKLLPGENVAKVSLDHIPSGVYLVRIAGLGFGATRKIVRE